MQPAWGSDSEGEEADALAVPTHPLPPPSVPRPAPHPAPHRFAPCPISSAVLSTHSQSGTASKAGTTGSPPFFNPQRRPTPLPGVPSLQALCLGCVGCYITDFLVVLGEDVRYLPPDARACLLAVVRRRGLLTKRILSTLLDDSWTLLDVCGARQLSSEGLTSCLSNLPLLRALDVSGLPLMKQFFQTLAASCPLLEVLRLGGNELGNEAATGALKQILPRIADGQQLQCDWEQLAEDHTDLVPTGRLKRLLYIVWPDMPPAALRIIKSQSPKVCINPPHDAPISSFSPMSFSHPLSSLLPHPSDSSSSSRSSASALHQCVRSRKQPSAPLATNPCIALDEPLAQGVGPEAWQHIMEGSTQGGSRVHIAEKFRLAYLDQARRQEEWERREWKRQQNRSFHKSPAAQIMAAWLDSA